MVYFKIYNTDEGDNYDFIPVIRYSLSGKEARNISMYGEGGRSAGVINDDGSYYKIFVMSASGTTIDTITALNYRH